MCPIHKILIMNYILWPWTEVVVDARATINSAWMDLTILCWKDAYRKVPNHVTDPQIFLFCWLCTVCARTTIDDEAWQRGRPLGVGDSHRRLRSRRVTIITRENVIFDPFRKRESFGYPVWRGQHSCHSQTSTSRHIDFCQPLSQNKKK